MTNPLTKAFEEDQAANKLIRIAKRRKAMSSKIKKYWKTKGVREEHGNKTSYGKYIRARELTPSQRKAVKLMADFMHNWPREYIAAQCGVSPETISRWRNTPYFIQAVDTEITKRKTIERGTAFRQLFKLVRKGNPKMLALYFKMTGDLKEQIEVDDRRKIDDMKEDDVDDAIREIAGELGLDVTG